VRASQADSSNVTNSKQTLETALARLSDPPAAEARSSPARDRAVLPVPKSDEARSGERAS
jgi:hypothetical protein